MMLLLVAQALYVGNHACAVCHAGIFQSYRSTPMARSSGVVGGQLRAGSFRHTPSGTDYRIESSGLVHVSKGSRQIERKLEYFIGSGQAGQSFLYSLNGFLYQAPVTWYSQQSRWDVSPGYESDRASRWNRAVEPDCLGCHSSQVRFAAGYENLYADPPFAQNGVGCERCHGPGSEHIAGRGGMINPAKLDPARRDAVCAQCHMSGEARIARTGRRWQDYRPGDLLSSYVAYFVYDRVTALKATSYVERLAASRCKIASGNRLWCGTCHDPHRIPAAQERVRWYRSRCLSCHRPAECQRGDDCASCHMPKRHVVDGGHGVLTDHSIPRRPSEIRDTPHDHWQLEPFSSADAGTRELGLAYAEVSRRTGDSRQQREAFRLLSKASQDSQVQVRLADLERRRGNPATAAALYESVLRKDPNALVALVNLGNAYGSAGRLNEAIALWRQALKRSPCLPEALANLATALEAQRDRSGVEALRKIQSGCVVE
ncbi:MAG: tetratricopeptide repeat protein [Bryobacteraceae bacterium]